MLTTISFRKRHRRFVVFGRGKGFERIFRLSPVLSVFPKSLLFNETQLRREKRKARRDRGHYGKRGNCVKQDRGFVGVY